MENESGLQFTDISSERFREYDFPGGATVRIDAPLQLSVSENGHRILDDAGISHYVPLGWIHLRWIAKEGRPNFTPEHHSK
jgi:hypothetical protein